MHLLSRLSVNVLRSPAGTPRARHYGTDPWDERTGEPAPTLWQVVPYWRSEGLLPSPADLNAIEGLPPDATVMEFGAGIGDVLPVLQGVLTRGRVIVVDQSAEVIRHLRSEFGGVFHFARGRRPRDAGQAAASVDYVRARRVVPYLNEEELAQFFEDTADLLKPKGALFVTAYHLSQTEVPMFRRHSLEDIVDQAATAGFETDRIEVAFIRPGHSHEPLQVLELGPKGLASDCLPEYDALIRQHRANSDAGDIEVEMRFRFTRRIDAGDSLSRAAWVCLQTRGTSLADEL
ncbi:hypothetical protein GCM10023165_54180 [Variovorax defluvii]|uniref:Methyltransferase type 12 domain-containing protein n=2 Tax=Variovorax defluvii TaxID=913761 RepID=A0ABP8IH48_9BURK